MSKSSYDRLERDLTQPGYEQIQRITELLKLKPDKFKELNTQGIPVGTLSYLKRGLLYGSLSTQAALNCFKDLAETLSCPPLLKWAEWETLGYYKDTDQIPDYRVLPFSYHLEYQQGDKKHFMSLPPEFLDCGECYFFTPWPDPIDASDE